MWLEQAFRSFLDRQTKSLEQALGLTAGRGAPRTVKRDLIARTWAEMSSATQEQIAYAVWTRYPKVFKGEPDTKVVRRAIYKSGGALTSEANAALAGVLTCRLTGSQGQK